MRAFIAMGYHMRRRRAIAVIRMTVVHRNIVKYMSPPANVIGLDQPYRKDCTGENGCCLWRKKSHDLGWLAEIGGVWRVAGLPTGRHPHQSTLDAIGFAEVVIGLCRGLRCALYG